jgi:hypothetical protein
MKRLLLKSDGQQKTVLPKKDFVMKCLMRTGFACVFVCLHRKDTGIG